MRSTARPIGQCSGDHRPDRRQWSSASRCGDRCNSPMSNSSDELVGDDSPIFHWRHCAKFRYFCASTMRTIQVRPSRNPRWSKQRGWKVFEGVGVSPVFCGDNGRESALSYARQRAGYAPTEIRVLDESWNVVGIVGNEDSRPPV